jgi:predicted dehydrogenase
MVTGNKIVKSALLVGCGSIGKRHLFNLLKRDTIEKLYIVTKNEHCLDGLQKSDKIIVRESFEGIRADMAVIANETQKHMVTAIQLASAGMHLFIEKPLSHTLKDFDKLQTLVEKNNLKVFVAYNLRFLKALQSVREIIVSKAIGDPYFAKIEAGQYLPTWRPERDYRETYSASREKGGGVALDLSHEIDYMRYLFGDPCTWNVCKARVSKLQIDTDDVFEGTYLFPNQFICTIHLDYLQKQKTRTLRIVGSEGTVVCDFIGKRILVTANNMVTEITDQGLFDISRTYQDEMDHFITAVETGRELMITLNDGKKINELIENWNV